MSTRSNIIIVTPDNQAHQFYHHCDGYLSGVGEKLRGMLNESANYEDLLKKLATPDEYGGVYEDEGKHDQSDRHEMHWDIEFIYIIKNKKLYYIDKFKSEIEFFDGHKTYKEVLSLCGTENEINLNKKVRDSDYKYKDPKPEKTEVKTMNYAEEKTRIENEIKELTARLENLKKQENKEEWKKSLVEKFKNFVETAEIGKFDAVKFKFFSTTDKALISSETHFFKNFFETGIKPAKVETEPTAEPTAEEKNEPENKFKIGDYVFYQNCGVYGEIIEIKDGTISIKEKDGNIYKVRPEWIYKIERPAEKPNETPEEKPVKMKMSLDELIKGME